MLLPCPRCSSLAKVAYRALPRGIHEFACITCGFVVEGRSRAQAEEALKRAYVNRLAKRSLGATARANGARDARLHRLLSSRPPWQGRRRYFYVTA